MGIIYNNITIDDLSLEEKKQNLIEELKDIGLDIAEIYAPAYKQRNLTMGLLEENEKTIVLNWITSLRNTITELEEEINNCQDESCLDLIDISYNNVLTLTNTKYEELGMSIRVISKYAFRQRLTQDEKLAIDNYQTNSNISDNDKAMLNTFWKDFDVAENVDLDSIDLKNGLLYLVQLGLIESENRVNEILS